MPKDTGHHSSKRLAYSRSEPYRRSRQDNHRQQSNREPKQGFWPRIKSYFWGKSQPAELGPPRLLTNEENLEVSRITHNSEDQSQQEELSLRDNFSQQDDYSNENDIFEGRTYSQSKVPVAEASSSFTDSVAPLDPNEALRQFFAEKGDEELNNLEIAGALSLIGQAVSRNESLVDFSNMSGYAGSQVDPTVEDSGILRALNAPPSPRVFFQGTPPPQKRSSLVNNSPWTSPRPLNLRNSEYLSNMSRSSSSFNVANNSIFMNPTPRKALRGRPVAPRARYSQPPSTAYDAPTLPRTRTSSGSTPPTATTSAAASVIMRALDKPTSKPILSRDIRRFRSSRLPENVSEFKESTREESVGLAGEEAYIADVSVSDSEGTNEHETKPEVNDEPEKRDTEFKEVETRERETSGFKNQPQSNWYSNLTSTSNTLPEMSSASRSSSESAAPLVPNTQPISDSYQATFVDSESFQFSIPEAHIPKEMTPDEEAIVANSRAEFIF